MLKLEHSLLVLAAVASLAPMASAQGQSLLLRERQAPQTPSERCAPEFLCLGESTSTATASIYGFGNRLAEYEVHIEQRSDVELTLLQANAAVPVFGAPFTLAEGTIFFRVRHVPTNTFLSDSADQSLDFAVTRDTAFLSTGLAQNLYGTVETLVQQLPLLQPAFAADLLGPQSILFASVDVIALSLQISPRAVAFSFTSSPLGQALCFLNRRGVTGELLQYAVCLNFAPTVQPTSIVKLMAGAQGVGGQPGFFPMAWDWYPHPRPTGTLPPNTYAGVVAAFPLSPTHNRSMLVSAGYGSLGAATDGFLETQILGYYTANGLPPDPRNPVGTVTGTASSAEIHSVQMTAALSYSAFPTANSFHATFHSSSTRGVLGYEAMTPTISSARILMRLNGAAGQLQGINPVSVIPAYNVSSPGMPFTSFVGTRNAVYFPTSGPLATVFVAWPRSPGVYDIGDRNSFPTYVPSLALWASAVDVF